VDTLTINTLWRPYYGKLVTGLRLLTPEWRILNDLKNFEELSNRQITWAVDLIFGGGILYTSDGGSTALAMSNAPVEATDSWRHMTRRFEVSYDVLTAENRAKFAKQQVKKQMRYQVRDAIRSFHKSVSINFYGSNSGVLFLIASAVGAPTYTVKDRYGVTGLLPDMRFVNASAVAGRGDFVAVIDPGGPTVRGIEKVTAVTRGATPDFTTAGSVAGAAADDLVVFANSLDTTSTDNTLWFNGLQDIVSDTAVLHGLDPATYLDWTPSVNVPNLNASLSGEKLALWFALAEQDSGYAPNFAWTTAGAIASAGGTQLDQRRYTADDDTMKLGFKNLRVQGVQTRAMPYCPPGYFYAGNSKALRKLSPDAGRDPKKVTTGGPDNFVYYGDKLGYFCDHVFRPQLTVVSRKALIGVAGVTETSV
jgi:hypothetical protein